MAHPKIAPWRHISASHSRNMTGMFLHNSVHFWSGRGSKIPKCCGRHVWMAPRASDGRKCTPWWPDTPTRQPRVQQPTFLHLNDVVGARGTEEHFSGSTPLQIRPFKSVWREQQFRALLGCITSQHRLSVQFVGVASPLVQGPNSIGKKSSWKSSRKSNLIFLL